MKALRNSGTPENRTRGGLFIWRPLRALTLGLFLAFNPAAFAMAQETTTYEYDDLGRLKKVEYPNGGNPGAEMDYDYDPAGNRTTVAVTGTGVGAVVFEITADQSADEGDDLVFTVTKTGTTSEPKWVTITASPGTAESGDFDADPETLMFAPAENSKTYTVQTIEDVSYEIDEALTVTLSAPAPGSVLGSAMQRTGMIMNEDEGVAFSAADVSVSEGGNLVFTITKAGETSLEHAVTYASADGTAADGTDYTAVSGSVTFAAAETTKTVTVTTAVEATFENDETLTLNLTNPTNGATISDAQAIGTISNDDAAPSFAIDDVNVSEGGDLVFTVTKSGATALSHSVDFASANGTAQSSDYTPASGTLTFGASETTKTVTVTTTEDTAYEAGETVNVNLTNSTNSATISDAQGVGTINDDDGAPSFSVDDVSVTEGGNLVFTITKSGTTEVTHAIDYATANNTAVGADYTSKSGTLSFGPAEATKTVSVPTTAEAVYESNETLYLNLSNATAGAGISDAQGVGTINNDDSPPSIAVNDVSATEGGNIIFTITMTGSSSSSHSVSYASQNGTATAGSDYTAVSGSRTFSPGQTTKTVTVTTTQDTTYENNETFNLNLSSPTGGATISDGQGVGMINNDDDPPNQPPVFVSDASVVIDEFEQANVYPLANDTDPEDDDIFAVNISAPSGVTVNYTQSTGKFHVTGFSAGLYTVNYDLSDGNGGGLTPATLTVDVRSAGGCGPLGCGF